jgi:hypothetical protein
MENPSGPYAFAAIGEQLGVNAGTVNKAPKESRREDA